MDAGLPRRLLCPALGAAADIQAIPSDVRAVAAAVSHHVVGWHVDPAEPAGLQRACVCLVALAGGRYGQLLAAITKRGMAGCSIIGGHGQRGIWGTGPSSGTVGGPAVPGAQPGRLSTRPVRARESPGTLG